ncbi:DNA polymerase epsilon subunit 2-like [Lineus longissimus]|uniref:DNA polymerase epsilon subunit 2-like n=1 Tax=Lineus longissimus TaxID=88925 RepID=UPI00315D8468
MSAKTKSEVLSGFKMHGLTLRSEASKYLVEVFNHVDNSQREDCLDRIIEAVQRQQLKSSMIDKATCEAAVQECNADEDEDSGNTFSVIDAFEVPRFTYAIDRKKFIPSSSMGMKPPHLHSDAEAKCSLFRERYTTLHQRTSRHDLFTPLVLGVADQTKKFQLKPVEFLLGSTVKLGDIIVLGMLTQLKEGKWYLEDTTGCVQLDLTNFHNGLFTENCFVLAEGWYEDQIFHVNAFGFPPPEPAKTTRSYFGNTNFFGGPGAVSCKASAKLKKIEEENEEAMMVFLSDVWLDQPKVLEKLRTLFMGYAEMPPTCFVFCGNFTSKPYGGEHAKIFTDSLKNLAKVIGEYPTLTQTGRFVFVPGPQDPGHGTILPRPAIPSCLTTEFMRKVPNALFTSNPCRIQYCTQEIVIFRENIVTKMCRNCVRFPKDGDTPTHFTKTIICQGHLCPLPLHVMPLYWQYDNALRLYPLPDLIICADKFDPFSVTQVDCTVVNPGSFPRSDFAFKVYIPATRQVEESRIED